MADRVQPPSEASGSLATEMTKRAIQEERVGLCFKLVDRNGSNNVALGTTRKGGGRGRASVSACCSER